MPSAPFASRELFGEVLLGDLEQLKQAQVPQQALVELVSTVRRLGLTRMSQSEATGCLTGLAQNQTALSTVIGEWTKKIQSPADVAVLVRYLERLALTSALVSALRQV